MKRRFTEDSWRQEPWMRSLCTAFKSCKSEEELANFLRDIATLSELQAFGERLEVAKLLSKGLSYRQIAKMTGASTTTVTRVAHFLENGEGGYRSVLKTHRHHRMAQKPDAASIEEHMTPSAQHQHTGHQQSPRVERPVSPLQKYLDKQ